MFGLKEGKTKMVRILASCPGVDLDLLDEELKPLEQIARYFPSIYLVSSMYYKCISL